METVRRFICIEVPKKKHRHPVPRPVAAKQRGAVLLPVDTPQHGGERDKPMIGIPFPKKIFRKNDTDIAT